MDIGLVLAGLVAGILIGVSGMGGGALMTPFLIGVVGIRPVSAVGTDLMYSSITKVFGSLRHWRQGTVDQAMALRLALGSVPGLITGVVVLHQLEAVSAVGADRFVSQALGAVLVLVAVTLAYRLWRPAMPRDDVPRRPPPMRLLIPAAFALGLMVGMTSVGSGSLFVVLLVFLTPLSMSRVVGTDVFHAALLTGVGALAHWRIGTVEPVVTTNLLAGSVPGVWLGSSLAPRLPRRMLTGTVAALLFATGLRLI